MSKYFAKYLAAEGEIKEGDTYIAQLVSGGCLPSIQTYDGISHIGKEDKKAKLFLCSRDIKVGDEVIYDGTDVLYKLSNPKPVTILNEEHKERLDDSFYFKIIGEVSKDALSYVKEGQEFTEDEVIGCEPGTSVRKPLSQLKEVSSIWIKGPCGHFH